MAKSFKRKDKFQLKMMNDGVTHIVWPVCEMLSVDNSTKFAILKNVDAIFKQHGTVHVNIIRVVFDATKYSKRWLCKEKLKFLILNYVLH